MENNKVLYQYNTITPYLTKECSLSEISRQNKINIRTLQRWVKRYRIQGFKGLNRQKRKDHGTITSTVKKAIEGLALNKESMSVATITRIVNEFCVEKKRNPISYYTVRKIVQDIPKDMRMLAQEGDKRYTDKYEMVMRRTSKYPNQIWQIDHSLLDLTVVDDKNNKKKPWLTIVIDDFSRAISGFSLFSSIGSTNRSGIVSSHLV
jgi:putative transposase